MSSEKVVDELQKDVAKLPSNMALDKSQQSNFKKKVNKRKQKVEEKFGSGQRGVCYIGHIPHGFQENQMKGYFNQFGTVTKLRLARSKRTGAPKGYAFVEFANDAVAQVVAETMNNYLMFHKLLKCQYLPLTRVHPKTFKGCKQAFKPPMSQVRSMQRHNSKKSEGEMAQNEKKIRKNKAKKLSKLANMGIDFEYPGLVSIKAKEVTSDGEANPQSDDDNITDRSLSDIAVEAVALLDNESNDEENAGEAPKAKRAKPSSPATLKVAPSPKPILPYQRSSRAKSQPTTPETKTKSPKIKRVNKTAAKKTAGKRKTGGKR